MNTNKLEYVFSDIWNYINKILTSIGGSCMGCMDEIDDIYNDITNTASNDLKSIAENMKNFNNIEVRICLDVNNRHINFILVKYPDSQSVNVPFENIENPVYIQDVIDNWFVVDVDTNFLIVKPSLFDQLEVFYKDSRKNKSSTWFSTNTEWIKFVRKDGLMRPCGFKRYKCEDDDISCSSDM